MHPHEYEHFHLLCDFKNPEQSQRPKHRETEWSPSHTGPHNFKYTTTDNLDEIKGDIQITTTILNDVHIINILRIILINIIIILTCQPTAA